MKFESEQPPNNITILERKVLNEFEDAVLLGSGYYPAGIDQDVNMCSQDEGNMCISHFSLCPLDKDELLGYVNNIMPVFLHKSLFYM